MKDPKLTKEEQADLEAIENAVFTALENDEQLITKEPKAELSAIAKNSLKNQS